MYKKNNLSVAKIADVSDIMKFIDLEWGKNHILSINKDFFNFQHKYGTNINFIISRNEAKQINGIIGYISASENLAGDIWTTTWKVSRNNGEPMLGVRIIEYLRTMGHRTVMSVGINKDTIDIYKYLGYSTGSLRHFFIPNDEIKINKIGIIPSWLKERDSLDKSESNYEISIITSEQLKNGFSFELYKSRIPYKDWNYFNKRYFLHPIFKYETYGIILNNEIISILILRKVNFNSSSVLRIVDYYGDETPFGYLKNFFKDLLFKSQAEYVDLYCYGMSEEVIKSSGFVEVPDDSDDIIIPNYFEPFLKKNIKIYFFIDRPLEDSRIFFFKADGDQDRPN
jgi:hypothetical protein